MGLGVIVKGTMLSTLRPSVLETSLVNWPNPYTSPSPASFCTLALRSAPPHPFFYNMQLVIRHALAGTGTFWTPV